MSPLGIALVVIVGVLGVLWYGWRLARAQRLYGDAQAGDAPASLSPPAAADWYPDQHDPTLMRYFDGQNWTSMTRPREMSQRTAPGRRGRGSNLAAILAGLLLVGVALYGIAYGGYTLWAQHSGIPAQVKITHCPRHGDCTGVWQQADGTQRTVTVHGPAAVPQTLDVHIRGDKAYVNSSTWGWSNIFFGIVAVDLLAFLWSRKRRQDRARRSQASRPNDPGTPRVEGLRYG